MTDLFLPGLVLTTWGLSLLYVAYELMLHEDRVAKMRENKR
jgi:hypothetical protein